MSIDKAAGHVPQRRNQRVAQHSRRPPPCQRAGPLRQAKPLKVGLMLPYSGTFAKLG